MGVSWVFVAGGAAALLLVSAVDPPASAADTAQELELLWRGGGLPGKEEDVMTVTKRYRSDLAAYCRRRGCWNLTAVEVGCYLGYTTSVLSLLFSRVFVLDNNQSNLDAARSLNQGRTNVIYLRFELYSGLQHFGWSELLAGNDVHVAVVDAGHRYDQVASDIQSALHLPSVETVVLDDYALITGVRQAVDAFIQAGALRCEAIGEDMANLLSVDSIAEAGRGWGDPRSRDYVPFFAETGGDAESGRGFAEGLICSVTARDRQVRPGTFQNGMRYACYAVSDWARRNGMPMLQAEVMIRVLPNSVLLSWPPGEERESVEVESEIVHGHVLVLKSEVPPLPPTILFGPWLWRGIALRDGVPQHMCLLAQDLYGLADWTWEAATSMLGEGRRMSPQ